MSTPGYEANKRWRATHPEVRYTGKKRYYAQTQGARNTKKRWTESEDKQVLERVVTDRVLAARLGRSIQAVQARRNKIT